MRKRYIALGIFIFVIGISSILFYHIWIKENDDEWEGESGDEEMANNIYQDVSEQYWASEAISYLVQRGMMTVDENNYFYPEENMKMEEFLHSMMKVYMPRVDFSHFSRQEFISFLQNQKVLSTDFQEEDLDVFIQKRDAVVILAKIDIHMRGNTQKMVDISYDDISSMDEVERSLIGHALASHIFLENQTKHFYPNAILTRAEVAKMIYLFLI